MIAIIIDNKAAVIIVRAKALFSLDKEPNGTFIPKNDDIIVGIDKTIVAPARNFII